MKRSSSLLFPALWALLFVLTACSGGDDNGATATQPVATSAPADPASAGAADDAADSGETAELPGVIVIPIGDAVHTSDDVVYTTSPPAGGDHDNGWQNCGFYSIAVPDEQAVHSLEHGAVWVTYTAAASAEDLAALEALAAANTHLLVTLYEGDQSAPLVATAWGRQTELTSASDPMLASFMDTYMFDGPTAPEPGVRCSEAYGIPPADAFTIG